MWCGVGLERLVGESVAGMLQYVEDRVAALSNRTRAGVNKRLSSRGNLQEPLDVQYTEEELDMISEVQVTLVTEYFPGFADLFSQLYAADSKYALDCMSHYKSYVKGPPNKPFHDYYGLLRIIQQCLRDEEEHALRT